jgi:hypothetical protein
MFTNYPGVPVPTLPGPLPLGTIRQGNELLNPGLHTIGGKDSLPDGYGKWHGEWLQGLQDEELSHPGIAAVTHQVAAFIELGIEQPNKSILYVEGELGWLFGHPNEHTLYGPSGSANYPRDMRETEPDTFLVFGRRTVVHVAKLIGFRDELEHKYGDVDPEERVGSSGWNPHVFRAAYPVASETIVDCSIPFRHTTLAVGDSSQVAVPVTRELGSMNASRLFLGHSSGSAETMAAARVVWTKMIPNGRTVLPPATRVYAILAGYKSRSGDERVLLETHVFADLTRADIDFLSRLVSTDEAGPFECQVLSNVMYLGLTTVAHYLGNSTIMVALEPTMCPQPTKRAWTTARDFLALTKRIEDRHIEREYGI